MDTPMPEPKPTNPKKAFGDKKPPLAQLPLAARIEGCLALFDGTLKYDFRNWRETPVEAMTYVNAIERHFALYLEGEDRARDTGVHNLGGIIACCAILLDAEAAGTLIDNRSKNPVACDRLHDAEKDVGVLKAAQVERVRQRLEEALRANVHSPNEVREADLYPVSRGGDGAEPAGYVVTIDDIKTGKSRDVYQEVASSLVELGPDERIREIGMASALAAPFLGSPHGDPPLGSCETSPCRYPHCHCSGANNERS